MSRWTDSEGVAIVVGCYVRMGDLPGLRFGWVVAIDEHGVARVQDARRGGYYTRRVESLTVRRPDVLHKARRQGLEATLHHASEKLKRTRLAPRRPG